MDQDSHQQLLEAVRSYQTPETAVQLLKNNPPVIITGVTASGKQTVVDRIQHDSPWRHVITHTTRPPRPGEQNGRHYWFVSEAEMLQLITAGKFTEVSLVHGETAYGTSIEAYQKVLDDGHKPLLIIDVQGIQELVVHLPSLRPVFLLPPSFDDWMERLDKRGKMSHVERQQRLRSARTELEAVLASDHYRLVINREIPITAAETLRSSSEPNVQKQNRELARQLIDHIRHY